MNYNNRRKGKTTLIILTVICIALIALSTVSGRLNGPVASVTGIVVTPIQKGMNALGSFLSGLSTNMTDAAALKEENEQLQEQVDSLTAENSQLVLNKEELERLQTLLELREQYTDYDTVAAHVISKGSGNWFSTFTIDKGTDDGISVDCNVLAGSGLCGIVTATGKSWARVRAIIDDDSNVSAMVSTTSDNCIIAGNLELIDEGTISLVKLTDDNNHVHVGDKVVTSNISEKYLPGILIGYIAELDNDANNLTKSGTITPVVDFKHLQEVLVIRTKKQYVASDADGEDEDASSSDDTTMLTAPKADGDAADQADVSADTASSDTAEQTAEDTAVSDTAAGADTVNGAEADAAPADTGAEAGADTAEDISAEEAADAASAEVNAAAEAAAAEAGGGQ